MQDQLSSNPATSEIIDFAARFHLLGIDPAATSAEVQRAYEIAWERAVAPNQVLTEARDSILDPARRLLCELSYPLDGTVDQIEAFYTELSGNVPMSRLLLAANKLPPLSKANFLVHLTGRQAPDVNLLIALVDAHAAVEATAIIEVLRRFRGRSGFTMPSLVEIRQGLQDLLALQSETVIAAHDKIQYATPLLECVRQVLSNNDRYRVEALSGLLNAYRISLKAVDLSGSHDINAACEAVKQRPKDESAIGQFETVLGGLISPNVPLILFDVHQKLRNDEADNIAARARVLLADLVARGDHETARKIVTICLDVFSLLPGLVEPFEQAATALRELMREAELKPLEQNQDFGREPTRRVPPIQVGGFGNGPTPIRGSRTTSYLRTAFFIALVPLVMSAAFLAYGHFNLPPSPLVASAPEVVPKEEPEIVPPTSKGERYKREFVRYCHFQEERLRVIKQHVRGPEDIQAYNMLANDYNSRCSNFYYLDEDLKIVTEEVKAKRQILEADAMRVLSTWPWHAASGNASTPAVK